MAMKTGVMTITTDEQITGIWYRVVVRPDPVTRAPPPRVMTCEPTKEFKGPPPDDLIL